MRKDDRIRLCHMLDAAKEALELAAEKSRDEIETERMLNLSLVRLIEIVGEAADHVSSEFCLSHSSIPWKEIIGMRHRLIHGYDNIDYDLLYQTIQEDLPALVALLEGMIPPPDRAP
jgi:uncharacterized protein with HEPN domain